MTDKTTKPDGKDERYIGSRVRLTGDHPSTGQTGKFVRWTDTPFGERPVVRVDGMGGHEVTVMRPSQWELLADV